MDKVRPQNTPNTQKAFLFKDESYLIRGAVFEVYREIGRGFLEAVYQECLEKELRKQNIPFVPQTELGLMGTFMKLYFSFENMKFTQKMQR